MKYFDMFSGIGGFTLGIQQAYEELYNLRSNELADSKRPKKLYGSKDKLQQWECVGYSETDKYAIQIYEKHFKHKNYGDCTTINAKEIPDHDLLVGGFPCQAFSIAGKRKGFNDTRGTLFFDIARILEKKRPRYLLLENVKGLLSHDEGNTFKTILSTITELGYDLQWQVLNSKNFGVPQNRERVFIVGHLRGTSRPKVFPFEEDVQSLITKGGEQKANAVVSRTLTATDAKMHLDGNYIKQVKPVLTPDRKEKRQNGRRIKEDGEPMFTLTGQDKHGVMIVDKVVGKVTVRKNIVNIEKLKKTLKEHRKPVREIADKLNVKKTTVEHWFRSDSCFSIPEAEIWFKLKKLLEIKTDEFDKPITEFEIRDNKFDMANRVYQKEGISPTRTTNTGGQQHSIVNDGYSIRRLTPTECERLQGFPDGWTKFVSDTQRYKTLGNAVTVNVIKEIMKRLL